MHTVVIKIWRGMVTDVYSDDPNTDVIVLDEDCDENVESFEIQLPKHRVY